MWFGAESNRRHKDFQSFALPTELPNHELYIHLMEGKCIKNFNSQQKDLVLDFIVLICHV